MQDIYSPPGSDLHSVSGGSGLSATVYAPLLSTKGWLTFIGVIMLIIYSLAVLVLIALLLMAGKLAELNPSVFNATKIRASAGINLAFMQVLLVMAIFHIKFGSSLNRLNLTRNNMAFEDAMRAQKRLWTLNGILAILGLAFSVLMAVFAASIMFPGLFR